MRKRKKLNNKVGYIIVVFIILVVILGKVFIKDNSDNKYKEYVSRFEEAILEYATNDLPEEYPAAEYTYDNLKNILISSGYLEEFENRSVLISSEPIVLSKDNYGVSFYNYYNPTTLENRFELKFNYNEKEHICTKNECK